MHDGIAAQIVDAAVVASPRQKLSDDEKALVRGRGTPPAWSKLRQRQKDLDARGANGAIRSYGTGECLKVRSRQKLSFTTAIGMAGKSQNPVI